MATQKPKLCNMNLLLCILLITGTYTLNAAPLRLLEADEISVDGIRVMTYRPEYYTEDADKFTHGANFNFNLRLLRYMFWENRVHFLGTKSQIRQGGWEYRAGFELGPYLQAFYYHHSQHVFEREREWRSFPLEDMYGIRLIFYKNHKRRW